METYRDSISNPNVKRLWQLFVYWYQITSLPVDRLDSPSTFLVSTKYELPLPEVVCSESTLVFRIEGETNPKIIPRGHINHTKEKELVKDVSKLMLPMENYGPKMLAGSLSPMKTSLIPLLGLTLAAQKKC